VAGLPKDDCTITPAASNWRRWRRHAALRACQQGSTRVNSPARVVLLLLLLSLVLHRESLGRHLVRANSLLDLQPQVGN
jgi:hypothetical protein